MKQIALWIIVILGIITICAIGAITGMESVKAGLFNMFETIKSSIIY